MFSQYSGFDDEPYSSGKKNPYWNDPAEADDAYYGGRYSVWGYDQEGFEHQIMTPEELPKDQAEASTVAMSQIGQEIVGGMYSEIWLTDAKGNRLEQLWSAAEEGQAGPAGPGSPGVGF